MAMTTNSSGQSFLSLTNITSSSGCLISADFDHEGNSGLPGSVAPAWILLAVINGFAAPLTVFLNLLVIWTVLSNENLRSVTYNLLLTALALSDLFVGMIVQPVFVAYRLCLLLECTSRCFVTFYGVLVLTFACLTLCSLMLVSVERYLAIEHPLLHKTKVTPKKAIATIAIVWSTIPATLVVSRSLVDSSQVLRKVPVSVIGGFSLVVLLFCVIKVQLTACRHRKAIADQKEAVQQEKQQNRLQEFKRTLIMALLVTSSILFYCPLIIKVIIETVKGKDVTQDFKYISQPICMTFIHLQSFINPLMSIRLSYIRQGIRSKLPCVT